MRHTILFSTSVFCLRAGTRERGHRVLRCCCCCFFVNSLIGGVFAFRALCFQFLLSHTGLVRVECNAHRRLAPLPVVELSHLSMRAMTGNKQQQQQQQGWAQRRRSYNHMCQLLFANHHRSPPRSSRSIILFCLQCAQITGVRS